jgi:hypothetical protein
MPSRPIHGVVGRIEWGYFSAAAINGYTAQQCADGSWSLTGTVVAFDAFKMRQKPLIFVAPHKDGEWRWPIRTVELGDGHGPRAFSATLGQQLPEMIAFHR